MYVCTFFSYFYAFNMYMCLDLALVKLSLWEETQRCGVTGMVAWLPGPDGSQVGGC